jgi:FixJ family two-component response regulator
MTTLPTLVFVLDDDEGFQEAAIRLLRISGIAATGVPDLKGLREAFPLPPGTCVLADIMLLGESGLDVPELLDSHGERAPVVFITATDDETKMDRAAGLTGTPCLTKPVELADLYSALAAAMARSPDEEGPSGGRQSRSAKPTIMEE